MRSLYVLSSIEGLGVGKAKLQLAGLHQAKSDTDGSERRKVRRLYAKDDPLCCKVRNHDQIARFAYRNLRESRDLYDSFLPIRSIYVLLHFLHPSHVDSPILTARMKRKGIGNDRHGAILRRADPR